jgi:hypothetical protein
MNKKSSRSPARLYGRCHSGDEIEHLLSTEEKICQAISARVPVSEVLSEICIALDCQIGNMVSVISLPGDDPTTVVEVAGNAELFGLHAFCSEGIVTQNDEVLGFLEMYCTVQRSPSAKEFALIERAMCLVATAIQRDIEAKHNIRGFAPEGRSERDSTSSGYLN